MNDCINVEIRDLLPAYLHGTCENEQEEMIVIHLDGCADCIAELELLRSVMNSGSIQSYVSPEHINKVVAAIPSYRSVPRNNWMRFRHAAAILIAGVGITALAISKDVDIWKALPNASVIAGSDLDTSGDSFASYGSAVQSGDAGLSLVSVTSLSSVQIEEMMNDLQDFDMQSEADLMGYSFDPMSAEYLEIVGAGDDSRAGGEL